MEEIKKFGARISDVEVSRAKTEDGIHLVMDGAALISQLVVYSNTTIECLNRDCGFYLADHCDCPILQAGDPLDKTTWTENVSLLGGTSREVQVCPYVFYEMCINSDGTYSLCRFDWNHAMILDQHVSYPPTPKKIWDSMVLWNFQQQFLKKERKLLTVLSCPKCGILKQGVPEDLDEFAEEILDEM